MLPARNRVDYEEIPEEAREKLEFVWLERVEDAVAAALDKAPAPARGGPEEARGDEAAGTETPGALAGADLGP